MKPLAGKAAIVTGASAPRGIGRAIALRLAKEGAAVLLADIDGDINVNGTAHNKLDLLATTVSEIKAYGGQACSMAVDVTQSDDATNCVAFAKSHFGRLDILVNNAGSISGAGNFLETTPTQWETSFQVNLLGPMMLCQAAIPEMRTVGAGSIINIGSTGSLGAQAGFGAYTAMKHGLIGMTKTIAAEFGVDGIRCNAVCPGYIMTDMHAAANTRLAAENNVTVSQMKATRYADVALRNAGEPSDVAAAVSYLAGPQSAYVTGIALPVAGGVPFGI